MRQILSAALGLGVICLLGTGCSQKTINSADQDTQHNITALNQKADQLAQQAKPALKKLDTGARVTAAITANQNLHGTDIRVDGDTHGVRLTGTVNTAAQKQLAEQVAKDTLGPGATVQNTLTVKGQ